MRLIDADALIKTLHNFFDGKVINEPAYILRDVFCHIDGAPTVELDESVIQETLNKRCMTAVANEYLIALHGGKRHDEWRNGEYIGGFYHVNCPCEDGYYSKWETNFCPNCGHPMMKGGSNG